MRCRFVRSSGRLELTLEVIPLGEDRVAVLTGGLPHAGAAALAIPHQVVNGGRKRSATASVLTSPGHRDDLPASSVAKRLSAELGGRTAVVCGIHFDDLTSVEIGEVMALVEALTDEVTKAARSSPFQKGAATPASSQRRRTASRIEAER